MSLNLNNPYGIIKRGCKIVLHSPETFKISLTEKAAEKVKTTMENQGKKDTGLRLYVSGGGCNGFQYGLAFDEKKDDDHVFQAHGVTVLVDDQSAQYLDGSEIDYYYYTANVSNRVQL